MAFDLSDRAGEFVFKPVYIAPLKAPIWVMQHGDMLLLDLRSVSECLGVAWGRWNLLLKARRNAWKLERCMDRKARETELMSSTLLLRWLSEAQPILSVHSARAAQRVSQLRKAWREAWPVAAAQTFPEFGVAVQAPATGAHERRRKVDERLVIAFARDLAAGAVVSVAAKTAGVSLATAKKIVAGTYTHWTDAAREAWSMTIGAERPAKEPAKEREAGAPVPAHKPKAIAPRQKVDELVVTALARELAAGASMSAAAKAAGISSTTAKKIATGTYLPLTIAARAAWDRATGGAKARKTD